MYILFLILPLILFLIISLFGRRLGLKGTYYLSIIIISLLLLISLITFYEIIFDNNNIILNIPFLFINKDILLISYYFFIDDLSITMLIIILSISLIVLIYSYDYMINDPHIIRFYSYIILFIFFMILLITTTSLPILFIGWESVGLVSFLLISYWYTRIETNISGILAILINRIGDLFYIIGMLLSLILIGSNDIILIISVINNYSILYDIYLSSFLLAAMAKSAQLYLHIWLNSSMEGPTPISSLIHAATMVTAGIFLLLRLSVLLNYSYYTLIFISIIGSLTCLLGSIWAITSLDIKELIAYSTMSQLGYMVTILGIKYNNLSFFHLLFHAYFKALLFLTAGSIIHSLLDLQDIRLSGSLINFLPISYFMIIIGCISLTGFPFTTGFYSKENIINSSYNNYTWISNYIYIITLLTAFITIFYSYKFIKYQFFTINRNSLFILKNIYYYSLHLILSLILLSIITIFIGYIYNKYNLLYNLPIENLNHNIPIIIKGIPIIFFIIIIIFFQLFLNLFKQIFINVISNRFYFKLLYQIIAGNIISLSYRIFFKLFDYGFIDLISVLNGYLIYNNSEILNKLINREYFIPLFLFFIYLFIYIL